MPWMKNSFTTYVKRPFLSVSLMRMALGLFFFATGFNKFHFPANRAAMLETLTQAGIPFPEFSAFAVSGLEVFFGGLLFLGLLTRWSALVLLVVSAVALATVSILQIPADLDFLSWWSYLLFLPESCYILFCIVLIGLGSGPLAVDAAIFKRCNRI